MPRSQLLSSMLLGFLILGLSLSSLIVVHAADGVPPMPGICSESDRFGVAVAGWIGGYDVGQLHAGWYHNFSLSATPPRPAGMWYMQTIRISGDGPFADKACSTCPTWDSLKAIIQANPSSLWIIGNEPDRQDYVSATRYAKLYNDFYTFIKAEDPTCQVGIGGVVQTTPIRLQYLDLILDAYQTKYGVAMPVDIWNVHHYLLREADDWGGGIPPGTDTNLAILYTIEEHDMLERHPSDYRKIGWKEHLVQMRQWMHDRGYRDRPLIITEYGILMPEIYGYDYARVRAFMLETFDWLRTTVDPDIGYPGDENRLVQAWAWYSLNDPAFEGFTSWSHLFEPESRAITPLGLEFSAYTDPLTAPYPGTIDLQVLSIRHTRPKPQPDDRATIKVMADIHNGGAETAHDVKIRFEGDGLPVEIVTIPSIAAGATTVAKVVWSDLTWGQKILVTVTVEHGDRISDCNPFNNNLIVRLLVADHWLYLPLIKRNG